MFDKPTFSKYKIGDMIKYFYSILKFNDYFLRT